MSKRIISFLLCTLMFLSVAGCGKDKPVSGNKKPGNTSQVGSDISSSEPDNTEETDSTDSKPDNSAVKTNTEIGDPLPDVSETNSKNFSYTVIRPKSSTTAVDELAKDLRSAIKKTFNATVKMTYDETVGSGYYEILIGATNRAESDEAKRQLESNRKNHQLDFIITVINEKICIYSGNEEMLQKAVSYFTESFCSSKKAWQRLNTKTRVIYEAPLISYNHKIAGKPLSSFRFVTPRAMEYIYGKEIQSITNHLSNNQGYDLTVTDERDTAVSSEIIVGDTSRAESKAVTASGDNWVIKETGGKLVIKGGNSLSLAAGIKELYSLIMAGEQSGKGLNIAKGFSKTGKYTPGKGDYRLVWNDEFNGSELNHYWWIDYNNEKYGLQENSSNVLGGKMYNLQTEATAVKNGSLEMYSWRDGKDFYSGKATTNYTMMFRYGIMEIRAKMPEAPGCASIWLNCAGTSYGLGAEFDILENFGSVTSFAANLHKWGGGGNYHTSLDGDSVYRKTKQFAFVDKLDKNGTLSSDYHVYTLIWNEHQVIQAVDGEIFFTYEMRDSDDTFRLPYYLIFGGGAGSNNYGVAWKEGDPDRFTYSVDYVRIYQTDDPLSLIYRRDTGFPPNVPLPAEYVYH